MISRDSFGSIELQIRDRSRFMTIAIGSLSLAGTLMLDRALDFYLRQETENAITTMFITIPILIFGLIFLGFARGKNNEYSDTKKKLFDETNIISDETIITAKDGSEYKIDHLTRQEGQSSSGSSHTMP